MSKINGNPLLSSAISAMNNLPSVLMPSVPAEDTKTDMKLLPNMEAHPDISLQSHLLSQSTELSIKPADIESISSIAGPPVRNPTLPTIGESSLRKPTSKYVVPPQIDTQTNLTGPRLSSFGTCTPSSQGNIMVPTLPHNVENTTPTSKVDNSSNITVKPPSFEAIADNPPVQLGIYHPVIPHWFYNEIIQNVSTWHPFSFTDSLHIEEALRQGFPNIVYTDGSRYDVNVSERQKIPVYWESEAIPVRRCSWFRRSFTEPLPIPYSEKDSDKLEEEFKAALTSGKWHRQVELSEGERVMMNSPTSIQHYHFQEPSEFPNTVSLVDAQQTPQVVRRGADDFIIPECASDNVDYLLFFIHGIGSFCDLKFRSVEDCVDDFRKLADDLLASHFKESIEAGLVGRLEILPISWHNALHGDATGIDKKLKLITLRSIPKFREFTNDTILDVLFFTSPVYGQHIMETVASEMERLLSIFKERNPTFGGKVSVGGHSLGTIILFDLLLNQNPTSTKDETEKEEILVEKENDWITVESKMESSSSSMSKVDYKMGVAGTGQPVIKYPQLSFKPEAFFLMGSPVGMFITVRGLDTLGPDFKLPTCERVFNIFHPFDPVAYRIETLIDPSLIELRPVLIPHHKGRKRMHLELKDTIERVGSDIKNRIVDSIQATWNRMYQLYSGDFSTSAEAIEEELMKSAHFSEIEHVESTQPPVNVGKLNGGRRIDYVLQEKPYESLTEYIFALQAHLTYWSSEDTMLMILKELYNIDDIHSDVELQTQRRETDIIRSAPSSTVELADVASQPTSYPVSVSSPPIITTAPSTGSFPVPPTMPFMKATSDLAGTTFSIEPSIPTTTANMVSLPPPMAPMPNLPAMISGMPRAISGRPVFDPSMKPVEMGVDPTATPASSTIGPPPKLPNMSFKRK